MGVIRLAKNAQFRRFSKKQAKSVDSYSKTQNFAQTYETFVGKCVPASQLLETLHCNRPNGGGSGRGSNQF